MCHCNALACEQMEMENLSVNFPPTDTLINDLSLSDSEDDDEGGGDDEVETVADGSEALKDLG